MRAEAGVGVGAGAGAGAGAADAAALIARAPALWIVNAGVWHVARHDPTATCPDPVADYLR